MKSLWMTSLNSSEKIVKDLMAKFKTYGLDVDGHFWEDNLEQMAWIKARDNLIDPKTSSWLILTSKEDILKPSVRYGLSLLAITAQAQRGLAFPIVILFINEEQLSKENLPTPLKDSDCMSLNKADLLPSLVAKLYKPIKEKKIEYYIDVYGNPHTGQWFEVGHNDMPWTGAMLGVTGAKIVFQAVGPRGSLPAKSTLNYPMKDLKLNLGGSEYLAWAVQNEIDPKSSYFSKIEGSPESIIFGPYSTGDEAEVHVMQLK